MFLAFERQAAREHYDELLAEATRSLHEWAKGGADLICLDSLELSATYENEIDAQAINIKVTRVERLQPKKLVANA